MILIINWGNFIFAIQFNALPSRKLWLYFFLDGSSLRSEAWDLRMLEGGGWRVRGEWDVGEWMVGSGGWMTSSMWGSLS